MKWYSVLGIVAVVIISAFVLHTYVPLSRQMDTTRRPSGTSSIDVADMSIEDMYFIEQSSTGPTWRLFAQRASFYDKKHMIHMHHVRAHLPAEELEPVYLEAEYGQLDSITGNLSVHGSIHLQYSHDYTIQTEVLYWHAASRVLQTDRAVQITSTLVQIAGVGLYGDANQQNFVLRDDVHASFTLQ